MNAKLFVWKGNSARFAAEAGFSLGGDSLELISTPLIFDFILFRLKLHTSECQRVLRMRILGARSRERQKDATSGML